jgi:hypothetical protein
MFPVYLKSTFVSQVEIRWFVKRESKLLAAAKTQESLVNVADRFRYAHGTISSRRHQMGAVDAVRQWRYAQTFLNGEPVSVIATVAVPFSFGENEASAILDEAGNLRAPALQLEGEALLQKLRESKQGLRISASPRLPFRVIEEYVRELQKNGIQEVQVSGFLFREGRLFQTFAISSAGAPEVALDRDRLAEITKEALHSTNPRMPQIPIAYRLFINEIGEVVGLDQQYGPKIPALESELLHAKVITPGRRGVDTVPAALLVEVTGPITLR